MDNFKDNYILAVKKPGPMLFTNEIAENKHGIENRVIDLNLRQGVVMNTYTFGNVLFDASGNTVLQTYFLPNASGTIALMESLSASAPLSYDNTTGVFSISQSGVASDGYLSSGDWGTFNGKENVLTFTSPLNRSTNTISLTGLTGFGNAGDVIKTNATQDGLEWGISGGTGDFMADGSVAMTGSLTFTPTTGPRYIYINDQNIPAEPGSNLLISAGNGYDFGYLAGGIKVISINTPGTGYAYDDYVDVTGGNSDGTAHITEIIGVITTALLGDGIGSGYTVNDIVTIDGGNNDATIQVDSIDGGGGIATFTLISGGTGYTINGNDFTLTGAGSGSTLTSVNGLGVPQDINIDSYGSGYSVANNVATSGGTGTNLTIDITEIYSPTANGLVGIINITGSSALLDVSLIDTTDKTFTFPNTTGTLALTSDIPDVSGFIPYIGANQDIVLGDNPVYLGAEAGAGTFYGIDATTNDTNGGAFQFTAGTGLGTGNGGYFAFQGGVAGGTGNGGDIVFTPGTGIANGVVKVERADGVCSAILDTSILADSDKTFTFPNQSGTFGLASDITSRTSIGLAYALRFVLT